MFTLLFLVLAPLLVIILILKQHLKESFKNLPPGPRPWPIIGNIHQMEKGQNPHITMAHFSHLYGPLISLSLGTQLLVVASSPAAAKQILKTHDRTLSGRHVPKPNILHLRPLSLIWAAECGDTWKSLRTFYRTQLVSSKALESHSNLREKKVAAMVEFLSSKQGQVVEIGEIVFATLFNVLGNICFSKDFIDFEDNNGEMSSGFMQGTISKIFELGTAPNISDFYPILDVFDPQCLRKKSTKLVHQLFGVWDIIIKERRESNGVVTTSKQQDLLDVMLANGFSDDEINNFVFELILAGTDTTTLTIEWAITELLRNREAMNKLCGELNRGINKKSTPIEETQLSQLPYLHACVKETLRLHPPVPLLLPHRSIDECEVMNYIIPKNCKVLVNVWAIGRDPSIWEDPSSFKPERFVDSNLDFAGQDFEFLPFGAGRRMCAGFPFGIKLVHLILASLIHRFHWLLPNNCDVSKIDMKEKFGVTLRKEQHLLLIPKLKDN